MSTVREVTVDLVRPVPAVVVRAGLAVLAGATLAVAFEGTGPRPHAVLVGAFVVLVGATVAFPGLGLAALVVLVAGTRLFVAGAPALGVVMALVLLVHLSLWAGAVAARTTWRTQVELAVLAGSLRDVALVQVGAQVLAVVATVLAGVSMGDGDLWRALALVAAIGASALLLPRPTR